MPSDMPAHPPLELPGGQPEYEPGQSDPLPGGTPEELPDAPPFEPDGTPTETPDSRVGFDTRAPASGD